MKSPATIETPAMIFIARFKVPVITNLLRK